MKSKNFTLVAMLLLLAFCSGCQVIPQTTSEAVVVPTAPQTILLRPLTAQWLLADPILTAEGDSSLIFYAARLTGQDTILLYSAAKPVADKLSDPDSILQIRDESNRTGEMISQTQLAGLDQLDFGAMKFEPRPVGAAELYLQYKGEDDSQGHLDAAIARFIGAQEDPSVFDGRTYLTGTDKIFEQMGYRISFLGWIGPPQGLSPMPETGPFTPNTEAAAEDLAGETSIMPTSTPFVITPIITGTAEDIKVVTSASLKIEDTINHQVVYLYVQFLSNGEIASVLLK
jgi:hypothetical protein